MRRAVLPFMAAVLITAAFPLAAGGKGEPPPAAPPAPVTAAERDAERRVMVATQIEARGILAPAVLSAMGAVQRHRFIPENYRSQAYEDHPVMIGEGQTISQPYIVALMTDLLDLTGTERVLEIGTGSGYQAAVLAEIVDDVYTIEIKEPLARSAARALEESGYGSVKTLLADGYYGWEEHAPFDRIIITAAVNHVPPPLLDQLSDGGILVMPLGDPFSYQMLVRITKTGDDYTVRQITGVLFVPMTGTAERTGPGRKPP